MVPRILMFVIATLCCVANAQTGEDASARKIQALLASMFDKPDSKVVADPVVVVGEHAIASWTQGEAGGRALLRRKDGEWKLVACGGDGLKDARALEQAGIPRSAAARLAQQVAAAERSVPEVRRKRFDLFGPTVDAAAMHRPGAHGPAH